MEPANIFLVAMLCTASFVGGALFVNSAKDLRGTIEKCQRLEGVYIDQHCISKNVLIDLAK